MNVSVILCNNQLILCYMLSVILTSGTTRTISRGGVQTLYIDNSTEENNLVHTYYKLLYKIVNVYRRNVMIWTDPSPTIAPLVFAVYYNDIY